MSNDVARFEQLFIALHYIWILPIQGALITFMIWESVGIASLAGVFLITMQTVPVQGMYICYRHYYNYTHISLLQFCLCNSLLNYKRRN